ncbi:MAG: response regulator transcription factor [Verrucomicrobia bacterium]|nr:response regulator transcription factor [Verrucomicrobiota bacterium]
MNTLRILIADDHELIRRGLRSLLETQPNWKVCAEAANGRDAVEKSRQTKPDVVVMDISMPDLNGLEATRQILKTLPRAEILILTMHDSEQIIREVLDAGAHGYVLKSDAGRDLVAGVESLSRHKPFFTTQVARMVLDGFVKGKKVGDGHNLGLLSPREREIIQLIAEGKSNKEMADALKLSIKTIETHRTNLMRKLGMHTISELVRYAIRNKIVDA